MDHGWTSQHDVGELRDRVGISFVIPANDDLLTTLM